MRVDPKSIVRRLNSLTTRSLEAAVAAAAASSYYEIVAEHLLAELLRQDASDVKALLEHVHFNRSALVQRVERTLIRMKTGNPGRPVLSESLFQWFEDAWLLASLQLGDEAIRSGHLLLAFGSQWHRYSGESYHELRDLPYDTLRRDFDELTAGTSEALEAVVRARDEHGSPPAEGAGGGGGREALQRFTTSFTERARAGSIDPIFGRHREIQQLVEILARRRKNNPIIVGEPGVGKTALVEGLALAIARGEVPEPLTEVELLELDMGLLHAGAGVRGEFEKRLKAVIEEVRSSPTPIVLFIDEAHTIVGKDTDAANLLKPALARGEVRTIAATTWSEYKKYFEKDAAFARRFQPVKVEEPSESQALVMLRGLRKTYEETHGVTIRDEAIVAAVTLSHRYIAGRQLPDKAVDLLDTAATRVRIEQAARPASLVACEEDLAALDRELDALRCERDEGGQVDRERIGALEDRRGSQLAASESLRAQWEAELEALRVLEGARGAMREGTPTPELVEAKRCAEGQLLAAGGDARLVHAEVDADAIARVVETWTGIPAGKMKAGAISALLDLQDRLGERVRGQPSALKVVAETLRIAAARIREPKTPLGVLLFVGPSGVGKTETATALADLVYGGERFMTTINMSEYQEKHSVSRLVGSPPGYVGYGEGGVLTEAVRQRPYSVVLLDECEKADLEVMNLFYQVFDKGSLADGEGRVVDFKNTVVILTSNLASEQATKLAAEGRTTEEIAEAIRPTLSRHFKPALLGRMKIVPFIPLPQPVLREIAELKLGKLVERLLESHGIVATVEPAAVDLLAQRCTESETGARNVDHILRSSLMPPLSKHLLQQLADGSLQRRLSIGFHGGKWRFASGEESASPPLDPSTLEL